MIVANLSFAQLSVRNNSFLFVDNQVLFVANDVNLEEATSYLYLRDEAQLIQGTGTTGNSGVGKLSVYQNGTVNEYTYNYWCSPVGNTISNSNSNRAFKANNNIYDVTSAPITSSLANYTSGFNGTSGPLVISNKWLYTFDPGAQYSEWDYVGETLDVLPGYGFSMKGTSGSGENQLYDFRGKPNNGTISTNVLDGQFTLVGNPYPSALDAQAYIHDGENVNAITGTLYYWEQEAGQSSHVLENYIGGYALYTCSSLGVDSFTPAVFNAYLFDGSPVSLPVPTYGVKIAKRYIPIGQGFMVEGKPGTTGTAYTKNSHRIYYKESGADSYFFRSQNNEKSKGETQYTDEGLNIVPEDFKRFRINVDFDEIYTRQLLMNFHDSATEGFDYGLEGKYDDLLSSDAHWVLNKVPYVIQAFKFDQSLRIPLVLKMGEPRSIKFRMFDVQNFNESQPIYVHDIENDIFIDLRIQDYSVNLPKGNFDERFEITFEDGNALFNNEEILKTFKCFQDNQISELTILNPSNLELKYVSLYDVSGKRVLYKQNLINNSKHSISTKYLSDGLYVAVIGYGNNISKPFTKKIIVANKK